VTLGRLILAWLPVAVLFAVVGGLGVRFYSFAQREPQESTQVEGRIWVFTKRDVLWRSAEALVATLLASLWFDSLGHGGWWLLFLLVGLLVALPGLQGSPAPLAGAWWGRERFVLALREVARYVGAGALLAWMLG